LEIQNGEYEKLGAIADCRADRGLVTRILGDQDEEENAAAVFVASS
jgi:hypothetical protein